MALQFLQDPSKTQQFQQGILRLVGDELVSEFNLTRVDRPDSARSQVLSCCQTRAAMMQSNLTVPSKLSIDVVYTQQHTHELPCETYPI